MVSSKSVWRTRSEVGGEFFELGGGQFSAIEKQPVARRRPPATQARFASVSASDDEEMLAKRVPENTKKATLKWVTVFNEYLTEKSIMF